MEATNFETAMLAVVVIGGWLWGIWYTSKLFRREVERQMRKEARNKTTKLRQLRARAINQKGD